MNPVATLMLFMMVALIAIGIFRSTHKSEKAPETVTVCGAAQDIAPGSRLNFRNIHYIEMPRRYFSPSMFTSSEQAIGHLTKVFMPQGEPITRDALFAGANSFSGNLEPSERAITLKLDDDALVDHEIYPGDSVDVLVTSTSKDSHKYTKTVGQDLRVLLSITKEASESRALSSSFNKITLAATPSQAELLAQAQETGKIRLTLRNKLARVPQLLPGVSEDDLLPASARQPIFAASAPASVPSLPQSKTESALAPPPAPMAIAPPPEQPLQWIVEMFSGSQRDQYAVPLSVK